jgi:predicted DNA-binding antitoxin AbrB/MazE fold protein
MEENLKIDIKLWYTRKNLLEALRAKKLPSSWMWIQACYEGGVLPKPTNVLSFHRGDTKKIAKQFMPIYTQEDIDNTVKAVEEYKVKKKAEAL